jgi:putative copper resistance protein D
MAAFADVVLRGLLLVGVCLSAGGVAFARLALGAEAYAKPDASTARALRVVAIGAWVAAVAQAATMAVSLAALAEIHGGWPVGLYLQTTFARVALARVALGIATGLLAYRLGRRPAGRLAWRALATSAAALVVSSAVLSHALARVEHRALLVALDAAHQLAAAVWVGGLAHLVVYAARPRGALTTGEVSAAGDPAAVVRRFSGVALAAVVTLAAAGLALAVAYVGDTGALVGTAYGVMIVSKAVLFTAALALGHANFRLARRPPPAGTSRSLRRFVEVELGLGVTVLFAAASLTSLPPAADVQADRATPAEVAARFAPAPPRLASPSLDELLRTADPLMAPPSERQAVERAWSEYNHHWAGLFVLTMGGLAALERLGVRGARHWPLIFLGLAAFLFVRNDPRAWPLGPAGFWESLLLPDVLQHRLFVVLIVAFGVFEWMVRTGRLPPRPWAFVFPMLCAASAGLLLTHSHAMFDLKEEFLTEVTHAPLGIVGAFAGWSRWLELRLPESERVAGWVWRACLIGVGTLLLIYREG